MRESKLHILKQPPPQGKGLGGVLSKTATTNPAAQNRILMKSLASNTLRPNRKLPHHGEANAPLV